MTTPELGTGPVPIDPYVSPEYYEKERQRIFRRTWLHMGRVDEVPQPGDYVVRSIDVIPALHPSSPGHPTIGSARFTTSASIEGNKLVWNQCGHRNRFTCKYHGWTYRNDGQLLGVSEEDMFFDLGQEESPPA